MFLDLNKPQISNEIQVCKLKKKSSLRYSFSFFKVLSSTVANTFESVGRPGTSSTVKFIRMMDQFFDCLNVSHPLQGMQSHKPALEPYTSPDDWRFDVSANPTPYGTSRAK